jgi:hypothetical protein
MRGTTQLKYPFEDCGANLNCASKLLLFNLIVLKRNIIGWIEYNFPRHTSTKFKEQLRSRRGE